MNLKSQAPLHFCNFDLPLLKTTTFVYVLGHIKCVLYYLFSIVTHFLPFSADTWPMKFDDSRARADWGWKHHYDVKELCDVMFDALIPKYGHPEKLKTERLAL